MMQSQIKVTLTFNTIYGNQGESILLQHLPVTYQINLSCESRAKYYFLLHHYKWVLDTEMLSHETAYCCCNILGYMCILLKYFRMLVLKEVTKYNLLLYTIQLGFTRLKQYSV